MATLAGNLQNPEQEKKKEEKRERGFAESEQRVSLRAATELARRLKTLSRRRRGRSIRDKLIGAMTNRGWLIAGRGEGGF